MMTVPIKPREETRFSSRENLTSPQEETLHTTTTGESVITEIDWEEKQRQTSQAISASTLKAVASELGVTVESLREIGIGFDEFAITFPTRSAEGNVIGMRMRPLKDLHAKWYAEGSKPGLIIPESAMLVSPELITEGETDLAAALTLGYRAAVATPGAGQCAAEVVRFFQCRTASIPCLIADNDDDNAGQRGAVAIGDALLNADMPYRELLVPKEYNDLRQWLNSKTLSKIRLDITIDTCPIRWPGNAAANFFMQPNWLVRKGIIGHIGPTAWAVFCAIASFANQDGNCYPDRKQIASLVGVSTRTVDDQTKELRRIGLLDWQRGGPGRANRYQIKNFKKFCKRR